MLLEKLLLGKRSRNRLSLHSHYEREKYSSFKLLLHSRLVLFVNGFVIFRLGSLSEAF